MAGFSGLCIDILNFTSDLEASIRAEANMVAVPGFRRGSGEGKFNCTVVESVW